MRVVHPVLLALLALALAACGGTERTAAALADGAAVVPAEARAYAAIATDADDEQWRAALGLLERFPDADGLLAKLREVEPALGPELVLVALGDDGEGVALTRADDPAGLRDRLSELDASTVTRDVDGWTAIAAGASHLDRLEAGLGRGALADDPDFRAALAGLPEEALAHGFVRGDDPEWAGGAVVAGDDGLRLEGRLAPDGDPVEPYRAELLDRVPDDALVVVSFQARRGAALGALPPEAAEGLRGLTGLRLETLAALADGEGALVVRRGLPFPELTLHLRIDDDEAAARRLEDELAGGGLLRLHATAAGGVLTVTNGRAAPPAEGERLADDDTFRTAVEEAGMPEATTGFTYVDVERALPLLEQLGPFLGGLGGSGGGPGLSDRLAPLRTLLLFGGPDRTVGGFAAIR